MLNYFIISSELVYMHVWKVFILWEFHVYIMHFDHIQPSYHSPPTHPSPFFHITLPNLWLFFSFCFLIYNPLRSVNATSVCTAVGPSLEHDQPINGHADKESWLFLSKMSWTANSSWRRGGVLWDPHATMLIFSEFLTKCHYNLVPWNSLCRPGCSWTHREPPCFSSQVLVLKAWVNTPGPCWNFDWLDFVEITTAAVNL